MLEFVGYLAHKKFKEVPSDTEPAFAEFDDFSFIRFDAAIVILTAANSISAVTESVGGSWC